MTEVKQARDNSICPEKVEGYLELAKVLGHLALLVHLDHQVKVALSILGGCGRVWPDHKLLATILIL